MREAITEASLYTHTTMNNIFHHRLLWLKWKAAKGTLRDGALENLWGRGGAVEVQEKYSRKGKLNEEKIHARQITLKNIHAMA